MYHVVRRTLDQTHYITACGLFHQVLFYDHGSTKSKKINPRKDSFDQPRYRVYMFKIFWKVYVSTALS